MKMTSKLITYDFADEFNDILLSTEQQVKIVSPFIGFKTANILSSFLDRNGSVECKIITRFYRVFLASINPSSAELNFPSTPFPLMGFHGRMC